MLVCDKLLQELCLTYRLDIPGHVRSSQLGILEGTYRKNNNLLKGQCPDQGACTTLFDTGRSTG